MYTIKVKLSPTDVRYLWTIRGDPVTFKHREDAEIELEYYIREQEQLGFDVDRTDFIIEEAI